MSTDRLCCFAPGRLEGKEQKETLLVVDDDVMVNTMLERWLTEGWSTRNVVLTCPNSLKPATVGYKCLLASTAAEGMASRLRVHGTLVECHWRLSRALSFC